MAFFGFGKKEKDEMKTGLEKTRTGFAVVGGTEL